MKTALILDPDLAFGFWLARGLDQAGYQGYPAKCVADAVALCDELHLEVSLMILDPALPEAGEFVERLRQSNQRLKAVALIGDQTRMPSIAARVDLCCRKPNTTDETKRREWIEHVEQLLPASLLGAALDNSALLRKCASALVPQPRRAAPVAWKQWEGRVVDQHFRLKRHLGGGVSNAVFLAEMEGNDSRAAAIRLVLADETDRELLLRRWERAATLSHPGLVRLFGMGSCESDGAALQYLVMEYAEENLADVLRQRPLTPQETREMLDPVLDALAYLHSRGLVHGHVKPSNILAISEQLKLSSDWLQPAGEAGLPSIDHSIYDAPESTAGFISPAADVWSLGITLVEALTQRPLVPKRPPHKPPALPVTLPPLFLDIAHHCLQPDPQQRETVAQLADHLRHAPLTPQSPAPPARFRPGRWRYVVPVLALAATFSGMLVRPFHRAAIPAPAPPPPPRPLPPAAPPPPVARHIIEPPVPAVSESSLDTIQGTIEVRVRVRVDASGSVVNAALDSPGPSRYFADRSLDAARYCKFDPLLPPNGQAPEDWVLRFDYTADGAQVTGERVNASKAAL